MDRDTLGRCEALSLADARLAAREYLDHREYETTGNKGVKKRMEWNAAVFKNAS